MSDVANTIHPALLPDAIRDERGEAIRKTLSMQLATIDVNAHLLTDPYTVDTSLLPFLVIERSLDEYIFTGIREEHLRRLIDFAPEIHAEKGTIAGVRKALDAFNLQMTWTQWFEETPKALHDTHKVQVFFDETLVDGSALDDASDQFAVKRIIDATKRWSQTVYVTFGYRLKQNIFMGAIAHVGGIIHHKNAPPEDQSIQSPTFMATNLRVSGRLTHRSAA